MPINSTAPSGSREHDVGDVAEHLTDDVDRLQRRAVADDDRAVGGEHVTHDVEHSAGIFELFREALAQAVVGWDQGRGHGRRIAADRLALLRLGGRNGGRAIGLRAARGLRATKN